LIPGKYFPYPKNVLRFDYKRPDFQPYGLRCDLWQAVLMKRTDRHNEIEVNYLEQGSLTYLLAGRKVTVSAGRFSLFWAAIPHQIIGFEGTRPYYVVTIPLAWFLGLKLPERLLRPLLHGGCVCELDGGRADADRLLFGTWLEDFKSDRAERKRVALYEIEARLLRLALAVTEDAGGGARHKAARQPVVGEGGLSKVEQMAAFIAQHYVDELTVGRISASVGLHPNYAMNLFRATFGTTLLAYLTELRVSNAQRLLVTTGDSVTQVALASGFNSISRFNVAFKSICGCSPRAYQKVYR
jgi:AraC-like DNA-binding protein